MSRTTRKRRLRCLYVKHPDLLSRVYDLRWELLELYTKLSVKIALQPFPPFYRLMMIEWDVLLEYTNLDHLFNHVRDPEHGL